MMAISPTSHRGARVGPGEDAEGADRLRQGQSDQAVLRLGRRRHHDQSRRASCSSSSSACPDITHIPYKGAAPGVADLAARPHPDDDAERRRAAAAIPPHRQGPHPRGRREQAAAGRARHPDRDRGRLAGHGRRELQRPVRAGRRAEGRSSTQLADETRAAMADPQVQKLMINSGFEPVLDSGPEPAQREVAERTARAGRRSSRRLGFKVQ